MVPVAKQQRQQEASLKRRRIELEREQAELKRQNEALRETLRSLGYKGPWKPPPPGNGRTDARADPCALPVRNFR
jgi:hypothetical protein